MDKGRGIGLIGGLGPGAAVHYYKKLTAAYAKRHLPLDLVMVHAETSRVFEYAGANDGEGLARYLNTFIDRLRLAGADLAVIPAVTPHLCIRELRVLSSLPVLNLFDPLVKELSSRSIKRVGIFGTRFVIESGLFGMADGVLDD
jgi:aspartate racemase